MKKVAMYLKHLIVITIPLKVNQRNNKIVEKNVKVQQQFLDNNKTFKDIL